MELWNAAFTASSAGEPKTFWDQAEDFWQGLQTGAKSVGDSVKDTATSLVEDPIGTVGDMAYNATIGTVEEIVDTAVWGGKMIFDADTREKAIIRWHSPDPVAASNYPEAASGNRWTAQIKIGNKQLKTDGTWTRNQSLNEVHVPIEGN